jgi:type VI secretion system protein ImpM
MPDPRPLSGLYGKVPAHGDFVRRGLPTSFVAPWDAWLAAGIAAARERLGPHWDAAWDSAPAWRFALPAGACGPDAVAGVMLPSRDQVGRRFPITLAALLAPGAAPPAADWFDALEGAALAGRAGQADADALSAALPPPDAPVPAPRFALPDSPPAQDAAPQGMHDEAWAPSTAAPQDGPALPGGADPALPPPEDPLALLSAPLAAPDGAGTLVDLIGGAPGAAAGSAPPAGVPGWSEDPAPWPSAAPGPGGAADGDGILAGLIGAAQGDPPAGPADPHAPAGPGAAQPHGTLLGLIDAAAEASPAPWGEAGAAAPDRTLIGLIGDAAPPEDPAPGIAPAPAEEAPASLAGLPGADPGPPPAEGPDLLAGLLSPADPDPAEAPPAVALPQAPPAPEGGGWWTRGGAHVPALVWPLPALPDPADFAYLLEAAA